MSNIEMVIDSIRVSLMNYQRVVMLKEKMAERYLPIWVGPTEADAIAVKTQGISVEVNFRGFGCKDLSQYFHHQTGLPILQYM